MILDFFGKQSSENILRFAIALALVTGIIDYLTGPQLTLSVFYFVPIIIVCVSHGIRSGVLMAIGCAILAFIADLASGFDFSSPVVPFWNGGVRLCSFFVVVFLLSLRQRTDFQLKEANDKLSAHIDDLEKRNNDIALLGETADMLQACTTREEAYRLISETMPRMFSGSPGSLLFINDSNNLLETVATWNGWTGEAVFNPSDCWAVRRAKLHYSNNAEALSECGHARKNGGKPGLCVPMNAQGQTIGVLHLENLPESDPIQKLAIAIAEQAAMALSNLSMRESLGNLAIRDPLTGLFNRRYMEESVQLEIARASREGNHFCVCMIDLDHFKTFNNTFGHDAGDFLLKEMGGAIKSGIRAGDIACRFGGEEFVVALSRTQMYQAVERINQLKEKIKSLKLQHRGNSLGAVTFTAGIAEFPTHGHTTDMLLRAADLALHRAKGQGRDQVTPAVNLDSTTPLI